jgi:hypothetical protein
MALRAAPHSCCPGRPALPLPYLSPAPQGTGSDWKNLLGTAQFLSTQTDRRTDYLFLYIKTLITSNFGVLKTFLNNYGFGERISKKFSGSM